MNALSQGWTRWQWHILGVAALSIAIVLISGLFAWFDHLTAHFRGDERPRHEIARRDTRTFLSEAEALRIAWEAIRREGRDASAWQPLGGSPTTAPDGQEDTYFFRSALDWSLGSLRFKSSEGDDSKCLDVEIERVTEDFVVVYTNVPK